MTPITAEAATDVHELRYGYNLADLDRLAKFASRRLYGVTLEPQDRYHAAWSAIAEHLYTATERPDPNDLIAEAHNAIARHLKKELHHHGTSPEYRPMPRYAMYWETVGRATPGPEDRTVDRVALWQIWVQLTPAERSALAAFAAHGTHQAAADALDIPYKTFAWRLGAARRRFFALWHEGERPSKLWRTELRANAGVSSKPQSTLAAELKRYAGLLTQGLTQQQIAARMGISYRSVQRIAARYRAERGL